MVRMGTPARNHLQNWLEKHREHHPDAEHLWKPPDPDDQEDDDEDEEAEEEQEEDQEEDEEESDQIPEQGRRQRRCRTTVRGSTETPDTHLPEVQV